MNKLVIFDIDGTLLKEPDLEGLRARTLKRFGLTHEVPNYRLICNNFQYAVNDFLGKCKSKDGIGSIELLAESLRYKLSSLYAEDEKFFNDVANAYIDEELIEVKLNAILNTGAIDCLESLSHADYKFVIYSNWLREVQLAKLKSTNILEYFKKVYCVENNYAKPATLGYQKILGEMGINPLEDEVYMIGNTTSDITPKKLNIPTIILDNGDLKPSILKRNPIIASDLSDAKALILGGK